MIFHARPAIRRSLFVGLGLLGVIATAAIITAVVLVRSDLRPYAEQFASKRFGHKVTIQRLTIAWGNPIAVDIEDVHVANPLGASTPDIVAIQRLRGDVALWPLMHGELRLDHVVLDHPVIDLEHNSDGLANWKGSPSGAAEPGPTPLPVRFIGAMHVHDGTLTFTSTAHHKLLIHLADADLRAANDTAPITINASGSYNDLPVRAVVTIESFAALSSVPHPVTMDIDVSSTHTTLKLTSTMTDPLGFDGVKGHLDIVADPLKDIIKAVGMTDFPDRKLTLSGAIDKQGEQWSWTGLTGLFDGATVAGSLALSEGLKGKPDHYDIALTIGPLDLQHLGLLNAAPGGQTGISLHPDDKPGETYKIDLGIKALTYHRFQFDTISVIASIDPSIVTLSKLSFGFAGGRIDIEGTERADGKGGRLHLDTKIAGIDGSRLLSMLGVAPSTLSGKFNSGATLDLSGTTWSQGLGAGQGQVIISMSGGQIAREFLQLASTDVRALLHKATGQVPVACALIAASMTNGNVSITHMRLNTSDGNLFGSGQLDLRRDSMDILIQSEGRSTDFWALDIPLRIHGGFANPHAEPAAGFHHPGITVGGGDNLGHLPQALRPPIDRRC